MTQTANEARHRMSGDNVDLKYGHRSTPLMGAIEDKIDELNRMLAAKSTDYEKMLGILHVIRELHAFDRLCEAAKDNLYASTARRPKALAHLEAGDTTAAIRPHKTLSSAESTAVSRANTVRQALSEVAEGLWLWVEFDSGASEGFVEVAVVDEPFILNIPHEETGGLLPKLKRLGFEIPPSWKVRRDDSKGLLSCGFLEMEASRNDQDKVVAFIERLGRELFGWKDDEILLACLRE